MANCDRSSKILTATNQSTQYNYSGLSPRINNCNSAQDYSPVNLFLYIPQYPWADWAKYSHEQHHLVSTSSLGNKLWLSSCPVQLIRHAQRMLSFGDGVCIISRKEFFLHPLSARHNRNLPHSRRNCQNRTLTEPKTTQPKKDAANCCESIFLGQLLCRSYLVNLSPSGHVILRNELDKRG